jgi:hypothetical protein
MCDECNECQEQAEAVKGFSRRAFLALAAMGAGAVTVGLWSCQTETKKPGAKGTLPASSTTATTPATTAASGPSTTTETAATETTSTPATTTASATALGVSHDLGTTLFPDANGNPIAQAADAPVIVIARHTWTHAGPTLSQIQPMHGVSRMTVHHTAREVEMDAWRRTAGEVESIREFHSGQKVTDRKWADIAYHFVVDRAGRVWQARPLVYQGAHVKGHNEHNLGIVLLGNFEVQSPTAAQLTSLRAFIGFLRGLYVIPLTEVFTHGELGQTRCPGKQLQAYMNRARAQWAAAEGTAWTEPVREAAAATAR